jgi:hypothetical protein
MSWVYKMININARYLEAKEYTKETTDGLLKKTSPNEVNLLNKDLISGFLPRQIRANLQGL